MQIKNVVLGIAIVILTIFVTVYGISVFYPSVDYDNYCGDVKMGVISTSQECELVGGQWSEYDAELRVESGESGYCDRYYECQNEYDAAREVRAKKVFYFAIPLGIILIFVGGYLFGLEAVGAGLMGGGVGTIVYGAGNYWQYGDDLFRFVISLLGLAAVIYLAYWFNARSKKKKGLLFWRK